MLMIYTSICSWQTWLVETCYTNGQQEPQRITYTIHRSPYKKIYIDL